jgi:hypothetical protein
LATKSHVATILHGTLVALASRGLHFSQKSAIPLRGLRLQRRPLARHRVVIKDGMCESEDEGVSLSRIEHYEFSLPDNRK